MKGSLRARRKAALPDGHKCGKFLLGGIVLLCAYLGLLLVDQQIQIHDLSRQKHEIAQRAEKICRENVFLRQKAEHLKSQNYVERVAREKLGLAKGDEIVYRIVVDPRSGGPQNASDTLTP